ncbi:MAG: hypothetical protein ABJR05_14945 [Balneola sp.]
MKLSSKPPRSLPLHPVDFVSITDLGGLRGELLTKPRTIHNSAASGLACIDRVMEFGMRRDWTRSENPSAVQSPTDGEVNNYKPEFDIRHTILLTRYR